MLGQLHWGSWTMINPTTFGTREGWEICLLVASPKAVLRVFTGNVTRNTEERASEVVKRAWGLQVEPEREVWWEPLQKTLRSRKPTTLKGASSCKRWQQFCLSAAPWSAGATTQRGFVLRTLQRQRRPQAGQLHASWPGGGCHPRSRHCGGGRAAILEKRLLGPVQTH